MSDKNVHGDWHAFAAPETYAHPTSTVANLPFKVSRNGLPSQRRKAGNQHKEAMPETVRLSGNWTESGFSAQLQVLMDLPVYKSAANGQLASCQPLFIDCSQIDAIDASGYQLLCVWVHCLEQYGVKALMISTPPPLTDPFRLPGC